MRVLIVDDHHLFRKAFCNLLAGNKMITEIAHAENGKDALEILKYSKVDAIFLDVNMPIMNGYETFDQIKKKYPKVKILMLTQHNEKSVILYFVKHGVHSFLTKNADLEEIEEALVTLESNHKYFSPAVLEVIKDAVHEIDSFSGKLELTSYEKKMIELLGKGLSSKELAKELGLTVNTVNTYRERLLVKASVKNVAELISFAHTHGVLR